MMDESQKFLKRIQDRLLIHDQNYMCIVCGPTGSGKSALSMRLCELLQPSFDINNVVFSASDFVARLKSPDISKGECILWDETGAGYEGLGARNFMSTINKSMGFFLQSFRARNTATFFSAPSALMIDSQVRALAHALIRTMRIDRQNNLVVARYYQLQPNPLANKVYFHKPSDTEGREIEFIKISKPSTKLWHDYLKKKAEWFDSLGTDVASRIQDQGKPRPEPIIIDYHDMAKKLKENFPEREKFSIGFIRSQYTDISESKARVIHAILGELS